MANEIKIEHEKVLMLSANLRKIHLFGIGIEYAGLELIDYLPSSNTKAKCRTLIHASGNFLNSLKNTLGEGNMIALMEHIDKDYEQVGDKWHYINSILFSDSEKFAEIKERLKGCVDDI
jgi:hypothetical protein